MVAIVIVLVESLELVSVFGEVFDYGVSTNFDLVFYVVEDVMLNCFTIWPLY